MAKPNKSFAFADKDELNTYIRNQLKKQQQNSINI